MLEKMEEFSAGYNLSLNKRLALISIVVLVPLTLMIGGILYLLNSNNHMFGETAASVTYANIYASEFRERMDYSMYLAVIRGEPLEELGVGKETVNGVEVVNPYAYMEELNDAFDHMSEIATVKSNRDLVRRMKNTLKSLYKRVEEIALNMEKPINYDENLGILRGAVYGLTETIEGGIQQYIYAENDNFARINEELEEKTQNVTQLVAMLVVIVILLAGLLSLLAYRSVTRPIKNLCEMARQLGQGDFTARTDVAAEDEIEVLAVSFNDMARKIGELVEGIKTEQDNLRITEMKLLQAQINPHFLYNTLDTVVWLAEENQTEDVVSMITWLSDFFRTTLSKGKDYITVAEERSHIDSYLKIQRFRYQDIMDYEILIDESIMEYLIPKLTLQPLVENALYHGIKQKRGMGKITIKGYARGEKLYFKVIDNGRGMSREKLEELRRRIAQFIPDEEEGGFGLANVNQRIQYYYGEAYGVFFESEENVGTEATVVIRAKKIITLS